MPDRRITAAIAIVVLSILLAYLLTRPDAPEGDNETTPNVELDNKSSEAEWPGLTYHGYFRVFDFFISHFFGDELSAMEDGLDWTSNSAHIQNAARQSNIIVVPHVVVNPRAYFHDPEYLDACVENELGIIVLFHTLAKYVYFEDPRPCSDDERKALFVEELSAYEESFRKYRDHIVAIYVYDEPWVLPYNVTHNMLIDMAEAVRTVFWGKPVLVMFHRQGNTYSYVDANGSVVSYDDWAGRLPEAFDIVGVDPYFYAYHDSSPPGFRQTGDKGMVESDVAWAASFGKPIMLVGQAFDPGSGIFFERDNKDPKLRVREDFEGWEAGVAPGGWQIQGDGVSVSNHSAYHGEKSLQISAGSNSTSLLEFETVHSLRLSFSFAVELEGEAEAWFAIGDELGEPVRLGVIGRDLFIHQGSDIELVNRSIDVAPGVWHSVRIYAGVDGDRWVVWFDDDPQTRLPHASLPSSFSHFRVIKPSSSSALWLDELRIERDWSGIPLNEEETMVYHDVASRYPQVQMLLWWAYPDSIASSVLSDRDDYQVQDVWSVQRRIWEEIQE